jgi:hypothetical protein
MRRTESWAAQKSLRTHLLLNVLDPTNDLEPFSRQKPQRSLSPLFPCRERAHIIAFYLLVVSIANHDGGTVDSDGVLRSAVFRRVVFGLGEDRE